MTLRPGAGAACKAARGGFDSQRRLLPAVAGLPRRQVVAGLDAHLGQLRLQLSHRPGLLRRVHPDEGIVAVLVGVDDRAAESRSGDVDEMERHAEALAQLDERISECGAVRREARPLTQMFVFAKENLDGDGVAELAGSMAGVYRELGLEASCMRALLGGVEDRSSRKEHRVHADLRQ